MATFDLDLPQGTVLSNQQVCDLFKCSSQGGMRRSHRTNTLVIISNHVESIYEDRWIGSTFHYTGMGMTGDQSLTFAQNKTLAESETNGVGVFLFEAFKKNEYTYVGKVVLERNPYPEKQPDQNGTLRTVWMFPLKLVSDTNFQIQDTIIKDTFEQKTKQAKKLSDDELRQRAEASPAKPGNRSVVSNQYERNPWVSEYAKRRAYGICQLCKQDAPFRNTKDEPYLEVHHVIWLSRGGEDSLDNTVALCPNCHRKMHILDKQSDKISLRRETENHN